MSKIKIKYFGPIKSGFQEADGWMDIKKVTVFIGNQGSGKSTVAKLISTMKWIEKSLVRGDYDPKWFERKNKFRNQYLSYHRIENYFANYGGLFDNSEIEYIGEAYQIGYSKGEITFRKLINGNYSLPQIVYVPAERNFISYVKNPKAIKLTSDSLIEFVTEFDIAKNEIKGQMKLPINDVYFEYDKLNDIINIKGDNYKVRLTESSSGFQSLVPLFLVSWYHANKVNRLPESELTKVPMSSEEQERFRKEVQNILGNENLTNEQRRIALSVLSSKFNKTAFINIVEEPEQNLFPSSQWEILKSLLEFNNMSPNNKLIMTTHSPYLINYLTLAVKARLVNNKILESGNNNQLYSKLNGIVPEESRINPYDLVVYELNENNGSIIKLADYQGMPSDENYLNKRLEISNILFDQLLEIEELCL